MAYNFESYNSEAAYQQTIVTQKNLYVGGTLTVVGNTVYSGTITVGNLAQSGTPVVQIGTQGGSVSALGGSVTVNGQRATVSSEALTTATLAVSVVDIKNTSVGPGSQIFASVYNGTNTGGVPVVSEVKSKIAGSCSVTIANVGGASAGAFNGNVRINIFIAS